MIPQDLELRKYIREQETIVPIDPLAESWEEDERREEPDEPTDGIPVEVDNLAHPVLGFVWEEDERRNDDWLQGLL
jgi:hypothetical protein